MAQTIFDWFRRNFDDLTVGIIVGIVLAVGGLIWLIVSGLLKRLFTWLWRLMFGPKPSPPTRVSVVTDHPLPIRIEPSIVKPRPNALILLALIVRSENRTLLHVKNVGEREHVEAGGVALVDTTDTDLADRFIIAFHELVTLGLLVNKNSDQYELSGNGLELAKAQPIPPAHIGTKQTFGLSQAESDLLSGAFHGKFSTEIVHLGTDQGAVIIAGGLRFDGQNVATYMAAIDRLLQRRLVWDVEPHSTRKRYALTGNGNHLASKLPAPVIAPRPTPETFGLSDAAADLLWRAFSSSDRAIHFHYPTSRPARGDSANRLIRIQGQELFSITEVERAKQCESAILELEGLKYAQIRADGAYVLTLVGIRIGEQMKGPHRR